MSLAVSSRLECMRICPKNVHLALHNVDQNGNSDRSGVMNNLGAHLVLVAGSAHGKESFAVDLTGAQYGWRDIVAPLDDFRAFRKHAVRQGLTNLAQHSSELRQMRSVLAMGRDDHIEVPVRQTVNIAKNTVGDYLRQQGISMLDMLSLPHAGFAGHRTAVLNAVETRINQWAAVNNRP
jgi:hypothetical protein